MNELRAPFPWFGGKRDVAPEVWARLGSVKQYIEPFCGSLAMLLASKPAPLEVVNDANGFIANFWRAVKNQPEEVAGHADYPVIHIDLGARHVWLMQQRVAVAESLQDPNWPGDAKVAGWWLWGQCCWIGSGWCDWWKPDDGQIPHASDAGRGVQALGQIPHASDAGRGVQALGKMQETDGCGDHMTSSGRTAHRWLKEISNRLERVRVVHGEWNRCLNAHYGGSATAYFLDPPYRAYEELYGCVGVADAVESWAAENGNEYRIALCGHVGDYQSLNDWDVVPWTRKRLTYSGSKTTDSEAIWFSPRCMPALQKQGSLF